MSSEPATAASRAAIGNPNRPEKGPEKQGSKESFLPGDSLGRTFGRAKLSRGARAKARTRGEGARGEEAGLKPAAVVRARFQVLSVCQLESGCGCGFRSVESSLQPLFLFFLVLPNLCQLT